ncbi:hypothetical protein ACTFIT_009414 [Dictyostelium discoideum]
MSWKKTSTNNEKPLLPPIPTLFKDLTFYILGLSFSETTLLKSTIKSYGGDVAFQLNKNVKFLLTTKEQFEKNCTKIQTAMKLATTEILSNDFVEHCITKRYYSIDLINDFKLVNKELLINEKQQNDNKTSSFESTSNDSLELILSKLKLEIKQSTEQQQSTQQQPKQQQQQQQFNQLELIKNEKKSIKLFISSTFLDMENEREAIVKYLIPEIRDYCNERNIDFSFVDMRWGITESKDILKKSTIATCLQEVSTCSYFISLLGDRYGWSSGDEYTESFNLAKIYYPWIDSHIGKSITELEILQATTVTPKFNLFYFKNSSTSTSISTSTSTKIEELIESEESIKKLKELKNQILNEKQNKISNFSKVENLITSIYKDLIERINRELLMSTNGISNNNNNNNYRVNDDDQNLEVNKNSSYLKSLLKQEFIKNYSFDKLNQFVFGNGINIENSIQPEPKPFLITSSIGGGKSTVLSNWVKQLSNSNEIDSKKTLVVCFFIGITANNKNRIELLRQLFSIIKLQYQVSIPLSEDPSSLKEEINYWYGIATKDGRNLIIIYDSIDTIEKGANETLSEALLDLIPSRYPENVKIVCSCYTDNYEELVQHFQLDKNQHTSVLTGFTDQQQILDFSKSYLSNFKKELTPVQIEILKKFLEPCSSPLFLSSILGELITIGNYKTLNEKLIMLLSSQSIFNFYLVQLSRWESDTSFPNNLVTDIIQLIYLSGNGLYEDEILSILNLKSSYGFFSQCRNLFTVFGGGSNYFTILSPYLKLAIGLKYFGNKKDGQLLPIESKLLSNLIDYFENQKINNTNSSSSSLSSSSINSLKRKIDYLPKILISIGDKSKLQEFLLNLENINQLSKSEIGKSQIHQYWNFIGINNENFKEIINLYKFKWAQYCNGNPPLEELSTTTFNIGSLFEHLSMYDEAYTFIEKSQDYHIQLYGDCHSSVANDIKRLVSINIKRSKLDQAGYQSEKLLSITEQLFGKEHLGTIESLLLNGLTFKKQTQYSKSLEFYKSCLKIFYRFLGYNQSNLFIEEKINNNNNNNFNEDLNSPIYFNIKLGEIFQSIADIFRKLGKFDIALNYYNKTLTIYKNLKKENHHCFSELYKNLGLVSKKLGDYQIAIDYYQKSLSIVQDNFGKDHVEYGFILCDLADTKRKQEQYIEAETLYNQSLDILKRKLNQDTSIEIAEIYNDLGLIRKKQSNYKEAISFYKQSITIAQKSLGKSHLKISFFNLNLADCYRKIGDYKTSEQFYSKCLLITQDNLGYDHIEVAEILNSIGLVYKKQGKYQQAENQYKRAIIIVNKSLGSDNYKNGIYMNNLADIYRKLGSYEMAKTYYNKALLNIEKALGKEHSEYAEILYCMGLLKLSLEEYQESIKLINQAIAIVSNHFSSQHVKIGIFKNSLAEVLITQAKSLPNPREFASNLQEIDNIRSLFNSSLSILKTEFGTDQHPEIADIFINMAEFEFQFGSHSKSLDHFKKALEIISIVFDENHSKYQLISDRIRYF